MLDSLPASQPMIVQFQLLEQSVLDVRLPALVSEYFASAISEVRTERASIGRILGVVGGAAITTFPISCHTRTARSMGESMTGVI